MTEQVKQLRRYSNKEIEQLVKEAYLRIAEVYRTPEEAKQQWRQLPRETRALLEIITVSVYRHIWYADEKLKRQEDAMQEIVDISQELGLYE